MRSSRAHYAPAYWVTEHWRHGERTLGREGGRITGLIGSSTAVSHISRCLAGADSSMGNVLCLGSRSLFLVTHYVGLAMHAAVVTFDPACRCGVAHLEALYCRGGPQAAVCSGKGALIVCYVDGFLADACGQRTTTFGAVGALRCVGGEPTQGFPNDSCKRDERQTYWCENFLRGPASPARPSQRGLARFLKGWVSGIGLGAWTGLGVERAPIPRAMQPSVHIVWTNCRAGLPLSSNAMHIL